MPEEKEKEKEKGSRGATLAGEETAAVCNAEKGVRMEGEADTDKLRLMVRELELIDRYMHGSSPPSFSQIRLYGLIWRHVSTSINLYLWEKFYFDIRNLPPEAEEEEEERGDRASASRAVREYIARNNITADAGADDRYLTTVTDKLMDVTDQPSKLAKLLWELRTEVGLPANLHDAGVEAGEKGGQDATSTIVMPPTAKNGAASVGRRTHEHTLLRILHNLEERGRSRRYAPPSDEEIRYYCEIRKWITSSLSYIQARAYWQMEHDQSDNERWITTHQAYYMYSFLIWPGQKLAVALYEIPEFQSLLKQCMDRFEQAISSFSGQQEAARAIVEHGSDTDPKGGETNSHIWESSKKRNHDGLVSDTAKVVAHDGEVVVRDRLGCGARMEHLRVILRTLRRMVSSPLTTAPTLRHIRLYAQLEEHLNSSIWMREMEEDNPQPQEYLRQGYAHGGETFEFFEEDQDKGDSNVDKGSGEEKTREQYLEEVVCSVEAIKSSFLCYPPTRQEDMMYRFLRRHLFPNFAEIQFIQKQFKGVRTKYIFSCKEVAMLKHLVGLISVKQEELLRLVSKQWLQLLRIALVEVPTEIEAGDALKWVCSDKGNKTRVLAELKALVSRSSRGIEMLDCLTLILEEMDFLTESFLIKLYSGSSNLDYLMHSKDYRSASMEIFAALGT